VNYPAEEGIFLTASYPERDTWKAASKYHILENENPHTITAYAIGARVGSGTPG